ASKSIGAEISPVNAPSFSQKIFCPLMAMFVPRVASTADKTAVNNGAMTISHCLAPATRGAKAEKNARVSDVVLYIFQLPAITRRRFDGLIFLCARVNFAVNNRYLL